MLQGNTEIGSISWTDYRQILRVNPCIWRFKILGTHWPCVALRDEISKLSIQRVKFTIEYIVAYDLGVIMTQLSYGVHLRSLLTWQQER